MMDEHLPEIFAFHVEELREHQRNVEAQLDHVVPIDVSRHIMMREIVPVENVVEADKS